MASEPNPAIPAATVVLVRDGTVGLDVLLLRRSDVGAFAGMWVFPGGRVDAADPGADDLARACSAAVRESVEEIGVVLDPAGLRFWSHWTPPAASPKRFATWFFVAEAPDAAVTIDGHEIVEHVWLAPVEALERNLPMAPPTCVTLHQLARFDRVSDVLTLGPPDGVEYFFTNPARVEGGLAMLWHGDAGYESGDPAAPGARHRLTMVGGRRPRYERSV